MPDLNTTCKGPNCRKPITMIEYKGKPHPYDAPEKCKRCKGRGVIANRQASLFEPAQKIVQCAKCSGTGKVRRSHFDTCVDAASFRNRVKDQTSGSSHKRKPRRGISSHTAEPSRDLAVPR